MNSSNSPRSVDSSWVVCWSSLPSAVYNAERSQASSSPSFPNGTPCSASNILCSSHTARSSMRKRVTAAMAGTLLSRLPAANCESCFMSCVPTRPLPTMPTAMVMSESVNPACAARSALDKSSRGTTAEMLRSEEPCAMPMTFTDARPRALKKRPLMFGRFFMPSPMTAKMLQPLRCVIRISGSFASSSANISFTPASAASPWPSSTATVMECSEDPCDVRMTLTPLWAKASIIRLATPCVPKNDAPESVTTETFSMEVIAFTGRSLSVTSGS
mmetsp:Transcript_122107/g.352980  ORF Transcript_122107/g.352980 Transcript_122107/m.352980 type:complete len:273 (+) Transcript_122107:943-1761(+)